MQLNIWLGRLLSQTEALIAKEHPDILCLQEVLDSEDKVYLPDQMFDSLKRIKKAATMPYVFFSPTNSFQIAGSQAHFGNAILSKYPIRNPQTIFVHGEHTILTSADTHTPNVRNLQIAQLDTPDGLVTVFNHHGYWEPNQFGSDISVEKMQIVADHIRRQSGPLIFAGDLNVVAESKAMKVLNNLLIDLTAKYNIPTTLSQLGKVSGVACDHILINDLVQPATFTVCEELVSDHKGLVLDFTI